MWLEIQRPEGLLILRQVLPEHVPKRLGLLWTEENCLVVSDRHLVGTVTGGKTKNQRKIPHAHANLHAVRIGLAIIGRLYNVHLGLLRSRAHSFFSLLCRTREVPKQAVETIKDDNRPEYAESFDLLRQNPTEWIVSLVAIGVCCQA